MTKTDSTSSRPSRGVQLTISFAAAILIIILAGVAVRTQLPLDRLPEEQREEQGEAAEERAEELEERREEEAERREELREEERDSSGPGNG